MRNNESIFIKYIISKPSWIANSVLITDTKGLPKWLSQQQGKFMDVL